MCFKHDGKLRELRRLEIDGIDSDMKANRGEGGCGCMYGTELACDKIQL
jgi:hypothetical protein